MGIMSMDIYLIFALCGSVAVGLSLLVISLIIGLASRTNIEFNAGLVKIEISEG